MRIQELQAALGSLAQLLGAAGANKQSSELRAFADALAGFEAASLPELIKYAELGRKPKAEKTPRGGAKVKVDFAETVSKFQAMYRNSAGGEVTPAQVEVECAALKALTKVQIVAVAEAIEIYGMKSRKKEDVIHKISTCLLDQLGAAARRGMVDRPA